MTEKSGIEMLAELIEEVKLLHQKVDILDRNIKAIANSARLADLITKATGTKFDNFSRATAQAVDAKTQVQKIREEAQSNMRFKFEPSDASKIKQPEALANRGGARAMAAEKPKKVIVKGKLVTMNQDQSVPLSQIDVQIFDDKDKLVKSTKTNRAGHWISHLSPGRYVVAFTGELGGKKLTPVNKSFEVPEGQDEFEVM